MTETYRGFVDVREYRFWVLQDTDGGNYDIDARPEFFGPLGPEGDEGAYFFSRHPSSELSVTVEVCEAEPAVLAEWDDVEITETTFRTGAAMAYGPGVRAAGELRSIPVPRLARLRIHVRGRLLDDPAGEDWFVQVWPR